MKSFGIASNLGRDKRLVLGEMDMVLFFSISYDFFFLFHTLVTVQKNLSRSDLFCFPIFFSQ